MADELLNRIIPEFHAEIVAMKCLHDTGFYNKCDDERVGEDRSAACYVG